MFFDIAIDIDSQNWIPYWIREADEVLYLFLFHLHHFSTLSLLVHIFLWNFVKLAWTLSDVLFTLCLKLVSCFIRIFFFVQNMDIKRLGILVTITWLEELKIKIKKWISDIKLCAFH